MANSTPFEGIFYMLQICDTGPMAYFLSKGRHAEDFFALKNPTSLAGFEPANLGTRGQHATPRPPKQPETTYNLNGDSSQGMPFFPLF
jgi:hypothetical protein